MISLNATSGNSPIPSSFFQKDKIEPQIIGSYQSISLFAARAADMIMEAVALMEFRASAEDMARISHPHPTFTEAIREAGLDATEKRALHV